MFKLSKANDSHFMEIKHVINILNLDSSFLQISQFFVALKDNQVIGIGRVKSINHCNELCSLGVLEKYRNLGIGTSILNSLKQQFHTPIYLVTDIPEYFIKQGFIITKQYPNELLKKQKLCINELQCQNPQVMIYQ